MIKLFDNHIQCNRQDLINRKPLEVVRDHSSLYGYAFSMQDNFDEADTLTINIDKKRKKLRTMEGERFRFLHMTEDGTETAIMVSNEYVIYVGESTFDYIFGKGKWNKLRPERDEDVSQKEQSIIGRYDDAGDWS